MELHDSNHSWEVYYCILKNLPKLPVYADIDDVKHVAHHAIIEVAITLNIEGNVVVVVR